MIRAFTVFAITLAFAMPVAAQNWSFGASTGAFVFGDFVERRVRPVSGGESTSPTIQTLSAATRPGIVVDLERSFGERWAIRGEATFTHSPLAVKDKDGSDEFELEAGDLDVTTFAVPIVLRINRNGTFRFHILGGPAYAMYHAKGRDNADSSVTVFEGTRSEWGAMAGLGLVWKLSDRFGIEGGISDIVTSSPFHREDFPDVPGFTIPKPHNVHTKIGLRYRF